LTPPERSIIVRAQCDRPFASRTRRAFVAEVVELREAVAELVGDGDSVAMEDRAHREA
jgi:hypothetical protein